MKFNNMQTENQYVDTLIREKVEKIFEEDVKQQVFFSEDSFEDYI